MNTKVVNIRKTKESYYYIGRPSYFGNKHPIGFCDLCDSHHNRDEAVSAHKRDFLKNLENPEFLMEVNVLKGLNLGCYCSPLACHGDIIAAYLNGEEIDD